MILLKFATQIKGTSTVSGHTDWITIDVETTRIQSLAVTAVLRAEHPAIRIVTITGDVQPALVSRTEEPGAMIFLRKDNLHQLPALLASTRGDRGSTASL